MPLESCMILLDNSQYMLNGDYIPTRLSAQTDAANLLVTHKTQSNPESTVGIIAMSGGIHSAGANSNSAEGVELLVSPTDDMGKILSALHTIPIRGSGTSDPSLGNSHSHSHCGTGVDVPASVQVASLALKHRRNKNGQQRIVIFVGSPLTHVEGRALVKAGKALKKNNVAIDVVALGELEENEGKLKEMVDAANGNVAEGQEVLCHLVTIPTGVLPSDVLVGSPIIHGAGGGVGMGGGGGGGGDMGMGGGMDGFAEYGGVDPNMDPELAMALRVSMEEERARQERLAREQAESAQNEESKAEGGAGGDGSTAEGGGMDVDANVNVNVNVDNAHGEASDVGAGLAASMMDDMGDEDALLQQALAMSMAENQPHSESTNTNATDDGKDDTKPSSEGAGGADTAMMEDDEDAAMQMALRMSMQDAEATSASAESASASEIQDPQFMNQLLGGLSGVDQNDPEIRKALENLNKANQEKGDGDGDDKKDSDGSDKK